MPDGLCSYFRLPPIDRRHLEARLVALPMGFSWALRLCQLALQTAAVRAGAPGRLVIEGGLTRVVLEPSSPPAAAGYMDDYLAEGTDEAPADQALDRATAARGAGLRAHPPKRAAETCSFPGVELRRGRWLAIAGRSARRLGRALEELLWRGRASGHLARAVVGHLTWASMVRCEAQGLLDAACAFMVAAGVGAQALWPAVRAEPWRSRCLLPLLIVDLAAPWASQLAASDAGEEGLGARRRKAPLGLIAQCGRQCERRLCR
ncbi:unnamed protein product, partial [Prorocentrum cordatum]